MTTKPQQPPPPPKQQNNSVSSPWTQESSVFCLSCDTSAQDNAANSPAQIFPTFSQCVVEMQKMKKISSYSTGARNVANWKKQQVKQLQKLVCQYGTDFDMLAHMMSKNRDQIKRKYKSMLKKNGNFGYVQV